MWSLPIQYLGLAASRCLHGEYVLRLRTTTVEPLLADTPNSGHLPYGQYAMYQLLFPYIPYFKNSLIADTPNSGHIRIADKLTSSIYSTRQHRFTADTLISAHPRAPARLASVRDSWMGVVFNTRARYTIAVSAYRPIGSFHYTIS